MDHPSDLCGVKPLTLARKHLPRLQLIRDLSERVPLRAKPPSGGDDLLFLRALAQRLAVGRELVAVRKIAARALAGRGHAREFGRAALLSLVLEARHDRERLVDGRIEAAPKA